MPIQTTRLVPGALVQRDADGYEGTVTGILNGLVHVRPHTMAVSPRTSTRVLPSTVAPRIVSVPLEEFARLWSSTASERQEVQVAVQGPPMWLRKGERVFDENNEVYTVESDDGGTVTLYNPANRTRFSVPVPTAVQRFSALSRPEGGLGGTKSRFDREDPI